MEELLSSLQGSPVAIILLAAGLILLLPALTGILPGRPQLPPRQRRIAAFLAVTLLVLGFALRFLVPEPEAPLQSSRPATPSVSSTPSEREARDARPSNAAKSEPADANPPETLAAAPAEEGTTETGAAPSEADQSAPGEQLERLRRELESLDAENQSLRERLDALESENVKLQEDLQMHQLDRIKRELDSQAPPSGESSTDTATTESR